MRWLLYIFLICNLGNAQENITVVQELRQKLDSIKSFEARVQLEVDIEFVHMPVKEATIRQQNGVPVEIISDDFIMIPKRGLDFTLNEMFRYPYLSINAGQDKVDGIKCEVVKIIPEDPKADYSIATLFIDPLSVRVLKSEISTKKNGVFLVNYNYGNESGMLPSKIEVEFAVSEIKIPLRFLGKDTNIDKAGLKENEDQTGRIIIHFDEYKIE